MGIIAVSQRQHGGHANRIVRTQGGTLGRQLIVHHLQCNGRIFKIKRLLRPPDHIHMGLEQKGRLVLIALGCGHLHQQVIGPVDLIGKAPGLGKGGQKRHQLFLFEGAVGDLGDLSKPVEKVTGLQAF